jgi:Protein of unknown function (DUF3500)
MRSKPISPPPNWDRRSVIFYGNLLNFMPRSIRRHPLASAQKDRVKSGDREAVHFAWCGPNVLETAFGYRVIGDGFVIEMGSVDQAAQHRHTIYHDLGNVLGRSAA